MPQPAPDVQFTVDPTVYAGLQTPPGELYGDLDRVVRTDLFYHYSTPICAQRWLDVCADPRYGHIDLLRRAEEYLPAMVDALRRDLNGRSSLALVSLGTGDGELDARLLRGLMENIDVASYEGLDFSFELLRRAVNRVSEAVGADATFPIRARCVDFTKARVSAPLKRDLGVVRLFTLTGFTLGNYTERELLSHVRTLMDEGDLLLLDARLHRFGNGADDLEAIASYDLPSVRRFAFGPVEVATHAHADDVRIDFRLTNGSTLVPKAVNLTISCLDLETTLRFTGRPVRRARLDLAVTTQYRLDDLVAWLAGEGFSVSWRESDGNIAFLLLKCR